MAPALVLLLAAAATLLAAATALLVRGALARPARALSLVVARRTDAGDDLFTLRLRRPGLARALPLPRFAAGQSVSLAVAGEPLRRRYSIARWRAWPFSYELTIRREPHGRLSRRLAEHARRGARLVAGRPQGDFVLAERTAAPRAVFVAGGVGITPLLAMVECWAATGRPYREAHVYWQVRHEHEAVYRDALAALARRQPRLQVRILVSQAAHGPRERIGVERMRADLGPLSATDFYLCASPGLLDALRASLQDAGVADAALRFERFAAPSSASASAAHWTVSCAGERFAFGGHASLLDAIEARGLAIDSDCRTGSCGRCLVAIEEGDVQHRIEPGRELAPGHALACCAVPRSDVRVRAATAHVRPGAFA